MADVDGDGSDDIVGRTNGEWWVARSNGTSVRNESWGRWSNSITWQDVQIADFNGNGKDDIVGRAALSNEGLGADELTVDSDLIDPLLADQWFSDSHV